MLYSDDEDTRDDRIRDDGHGIYGSRDRTEAEEGDIGEDNCDVISATGCLMMVAWVTLTSIGITMARHYKGLISGTEVCGKQVWFQVQCPFSLNYYQ